MELAAEQARQWEQRHQQDYFGIDNQYTEKLKEGYFTLSEDPDIMTSTMRHVYGTLQFFEDDPKHHIFFGPETTVLELGCGYGGFGCRVAAHVNDYVGVDISTRIVSEGNQAIQQAGIKNMTLLPAPDCDLLSVLGSRTFDVVFSTALYIHTPPEITKRYLKATGSLLNANGRFTNQINMARAPAKEIHQEITHNYSEASYADLFVGCGLLVTDEDDWEEYLPGLFARISVGTYA